MGRSSRDTAIFIISYTPYSADTIPWFIAASRHFQSDMLWDRSAEDHYGIAAISGRYFVYRPRLATIKRTREIGFHQPGLIFKSVSGYLYQVDAII